MPKSGAPDLPLILAVPSLALLLLSAGWVLRRRTSTSR